MLAINATFIGQFIVLLVLLWFVYKVVVPMLAGPIEERSRKIAQGLAAAEEGRKAYADAEAKAAAVIQEARERAGHILDAAQKRANEIVEQAKQTASAEGSRLVAAAKQQIELEATRAREDLRKDVGALAVKTAARVLEREVDARAHAELIAKLATEI
jgi:F-type H+-transporting ATPase subunit b